MMILAIETSTPRASLALWDREAGRAVWEAGFTTDRSHNSVIFGPVGEALEIAGDRLDRIAVGVGPGSYTGVRVAIAVANGLGFARGIPAVGISSLASYPEADCLVVGDARRKTFFRAEIRARVLRAEPDLLNREELAEAIGAEPGIPVFTADRHVADDFAGDIRLAFPEAKRIAELAPDLDEVAEVPLEPHYLRAPYITTPKAKGGAG